jgi:hypothetical protein
VHRRPVSKQPAKELPPFGPKRFSPLKKGNRMKKSLLFASFLALALAGCQKKEEPKPAEPPKAEASAPAPAAPAAPAADAKDGAAPAAAPAADAKDGKDAAPADPAKK